MSQEHDAGAWNACTVRIAQSPVPVDWGSEYYLSRGS